MRHRSTLRSDIGSLTDARLKLERAAGIPAKRGERDTQCPRCPKVLRGRMGLRHHLEQAHGETE